jgi:large subunit ribosomal protein L13
MAVLKNKCYWMREEDTPRDWYHIDAAGKVLGKVAVQAARALMGKHKPTYTPGVDCGNYVVITNASKVCVTGKKLEKRYYRYHTGYLGGLKETRYDHLLAKKPEWVVKLAVRRMLPKKNLGQKLFKRLKVYADAKHPHSAHQPQALAVR